MDELDILDVPVSCGSISQVYKVFYKGKPAALKIQHPDLINEVNAVSWILKLFYKCGKLKNVDVDEFFKAFFAQLDFVNEAENCKTFHTVFENVNCVKIPELYYAQRKLIIMEWIDGFSVNECCDKVRKSEIVSKVSLTMKYSVIKQGIMHCDMHIGNWKYVFNGTEIVIVLYDFGLITKCPINTFKEILHLWGKCEYTQMYRRMLAISGVHQDIMDKQEFKKIEHGGIPNIMQIYEQANEFLNNNEGSLPNWVYHMAVAQSLVEKLMIDEGFYLFSDSVQGLVDGYFSILCEQDSFCQKHNINNDFSNYVIECINDIRPKNLFGIESTDSIDNFYNVFKNKKSNITNGKNI
jgi:uncharacterized protein YlbG (UPF0298 family)